MWRGTVALSLLLALPGAGPVGAEEPPLLLSYLAPGATEEAAAVRGALERVAHTRGTALIDLSPPPAAAPRAAAHLARVIAADAAFRHEETRTEVERGIAEAELTGADGLSPAELSELFLYRAISLTQAGETTRAWEDLVRAAVVDPAHQLDPARFPPSVVRSFGRALQEVQAGVHGDLTVRVPTSCAARVDGRALADGAAVRLPRGAHFIRVTCAGYLPFGGLAVIEGASHVIEPSLVRLAAPSAARAAEIAQARGARRALLVTVRVSDGAPPTLALELIDAASERATLRRFVLLDGEAGSRIEAAAARLVDEAARLDAAARAASSAAPPASQRSARWYRNPWLWGAAGAALSAAILVPWAIARDGGNAASGFDIELDDLP